MSEAKVGLFRLEILEKQRRAPCGCSWRSKSISRTFRILFPTVFADCRCAICQQTWTERFEFDFSVPLGGITNEQAESVNNEEVTL